MTDKSIIRKTPTQCASLLTAISLLCISHSALAQSENNGEAEYMGLEGGRPFFSLAFKNIELSGTNNEGTGVGLTVGYEVFRPTVLGSPNIALNFTFADLDNDVEYNSLALIGGFRGWGTRVFPLYGLGIARQSVKYSFGEDTSFNQFLYYAGIGATFGRGFNGDIRYTGTTPLGQDDSNPANDNISAISLRIGWGGFSGISRL